MGKGDKRSVAQRGDGGKSVFIEYISSMNDRGITQLYNALREIKRERERAILFMYP